MLADIDSLGLFVVAGLLLNLTPGPDVLYVVGHALRSGARAGMVAALGITAGCFVHIVAAAVGVSALVAASATAFAALKWLGAAYLVYVGLSMLLARRRSAPEWGQGAAPAEQQGRRKVFLQGFWTNALNPKVALFFLAFVPQFIAPGASDKTLAFLLLGLLFNLNGLWVNIGWALLAAWVAGRLGALRRSLGWLQRVAGALFIGFGLRLALAEPPAA